MNATLQMLRSIPEAQDSLSAYVPCSESWLMERYTPVASGLAAFTTQDIDGKGRALTVGLRNLYNSMSETPEAFNPRMFLEVVPGPPPG